MDYIDYTLNQYYEDQEKYEEIARKMVEEGLDPSDPDDYEKYINELADDDGDHDAYDRLSGN